MPKSPGASHELTISIVTYYPDIAEFHRTLKCLKASIDVLQQQNPMHVRIVVVDNSVNEHVAARIQETMQRHLGELSELVCLPINAGYGVGHNQATKNSNSHWYLVMNADVELDVDALSAAVTYLNDPGHRAVALVSPHCQTGDGQRAYLCKRYPCVLDLALRGFAPVWLKIFFERRLAHYEYRQETGQKSVYPVTIASGCFMFFRGEIWRQLDGFSPDYFLYFEDFDLCMRLGQVSCIRYVSAIRIIHHGGHAARKGIAHVILFVRSAYRFFSTHGWRFI